MLGAIINNPQKRTINKKLDKRIRVRGGLWNEIRPEDNQSMKKAGYVIIARPPVMSEIIRTGQCAGAISIKPEELPERVRGIAEGMLV